MPTFMALVVATLVAWSVESTIPNPVGVRLSAVAALFVWVGAFLLTRKLLLDLRP